MNINRWLGFDENDGEWDSSVWDKQPIGIIELICVILTIAFIWVL